jgi:putative ABC transport system ATP-binding protein
MSIWRGKNLGIVFQFFQLLPTLTLLENVMLPMYLAGISTAAGREAYALSLLKMVGLASLADKLPAAVSGGQQQSAAIARALANDPPILIADEPTGNLDSRTADEVFDLFAGLIDQGKSILMVTHDIGLAGRTTRTLLISDGELVDPWAASMFNRLDHTQLLWLTHHLEARDFPPGAMLKTGSPEGDWLYLVTGGTLEVTNGKVNGNGHASVRLGSGQYLSALDLRAAGLAGAGLKAGGSESLELLMVEGADLGHWWSQASVQAGLERGASWLHTPEKEVSR